MTNRNGQLDLPSGDLVYIHWHLGSGPSLLFHPDFGLTAAACKSSEAGNGYVSFEAVNFFSNFEDLPSLDSLVFTLV